MTTIFSEDQVSDNYLANLREQLTIFMNRSKIEIEEIHLQELGQSFLQEINQRFTNENQIIRYIAGKWNDFINSWMCIKEEHQSQIKDLNQQLQQKAGSIDNLQEIVSFLENKMVIYEEQNEKLKVEFSTLTQKMEKLEVESLSYKKLAENNHKEIIQACGKRKHAITTLMNQKQILLDQIKNERKINLEMDYEVSQLANKFQLYERQCKIYECKLNESTKYCQQLESILNQKNETILNLQNQLKQLYHKQYESVVASEPLDGDVNLDPQNQQKFDNNNKLQDQIPYGMEPFAYQFHRRLSELTLIPNKLLDDDTSNPLKMTMDPYFAHFVLTSQSVKIKQDCEQLLNIDAKPFYPEIVEKRIPMHLWDQWIRNKLKQILNLRKATNYFDSQDDQ